MVNTNTSATGGYLSPSWQSGEDSTELTNLIQAAVAGVTGIDPTLIRPRWQPQPPTQPSAEVDWGALGVTSYERHDYPQQSMDKAGIYSFGRWERINLLVTLYGPNAHHYSEWVRDAFYIEQNRWPLLQHGIKFRGAENITYLGELINSQFISRADIPLNFERAITRVYPILPLEGAEVDFVTDDGLSCVETITPVEN